MDAARCTSIFDFFEGLDATDDHARRMDSLLAQEPYLLLRTTSGARHASRLRVSDLPRGVRFGRADKTTQTLDHIVKTAEEACVEAAPEERAEERAEECAEERAEASPSSCANPAEEAPRKAAASRSVCEGFACPSCGHVFAARATLRLHIKAGACA